MGIVKTDHPLYLKPLFAGCIIILFSENLMTGTLCSGPLEVSAVFQQPEKEGNLKKKIFQ